MTWNKIVFTAFVAALSVMLSAGEFDGYKKSAVELSESLEQIEDSGFEKARRINHYTEVIPHIGYNGSGGIRITAKSKQRRYAIPLKLRPQPGKKYVLTVYEKVSGKVHSHIYFEAYKGGKYQYSNWNVSRTKLDGGWYKCELSIVSKGETPAADFTYDYMLCVSPKEKTSGPGDYVEYDNISIREDKPDWYLTNTYPTHNKVFNTDGYIRFHSSFNGAWLAKDAKPAYHVELVANNKVIAAKTATERANGVLEVEFGKLNYDGPAILRTTLYDRQNKLNTGSKEIAITITKPYVPKKGEIIITKDGQALVDGKPYMPLGFMSSIGKRHSRDMKATEEHLKRIHDAGYNFLVEYWIDAYRGENRDAFMALLEKYNFRLLYNLTPSVHYQDQLESKYRPLVKEVSKYPAIIGWYTVDEGSVQLLPFYDKLRRMLNEETPGHVVWACNIFEPSPYLLAGDVQGGDSYPIGKPESNLLSMNKYMTKTADCHPSIMWHSPQCMNWANYRRGAMESEEAYRAAGREPTEQEMLAVALLYATHGVKGFIFYNYSDIETSMVKEWIPKRWEAMKNIGRILKSLEPFIISGKKHLILPCKDLKGQTRIAALSDGKGKYRILVVGLNVDNEAEFQLPAKYGKFKSLYGNCKEENGRWKFTGKSFSCDVLEQ